MSVRTIQYLLASVFFVLGGWCLFWPSSVVDLAFRPEFQSDARIVPILMACFGAQAVIAGTFAAFATFTRATFAAYAVVLLPFFVFDYWFYVVDPIMTEFLLLDAVGNAIMLALCYLGWRKAPAAAADARPRVGGIGRWPVAGAIGIGLLAVDFSVVTPLPTFVGTAHAVIGRPLTPTSGAGVARRTTRRTVRRTTTFVATLPPACVRASIAGVAVWRCGGTYYQRHAGRYVVVHVD
jgi:hypothetical protein